jgi:predicted DsbA family dithiol-disulfide isomerase
VRWRAFPLHPDTPEEGLYVEKLFENYPVDVNEMMGRLKNKAAELGLPFGERTKTYNSRLAQELGSWADSKKKGDQFHLAAFKAYFVEGKNIAKFPVLLELAASVGLAREEAEAVLSSRAFKDPVDEDWAISRARGITAVPTFVIHQDKLVGAQPYETLKEFMAANGVSRTAS